MATADATGQSFEKVMEDFRNDAFPCTDMSDNELAKTHIRHLAGGRSHAAHERLFRFHFPEVSGPVLFFCYTSLASSWTNNAFALIY